MLHFFKFMIKMSKPKDTICLSMSKFCELETIISVAFKVYYSLFLLTSTLLV